MKSKSIILLALCLFIALATQLSFAATLPSVAGDCTGDGVLDSADTTLLRAEIYNNDGTYPTACDANQDGTLDAGDLTCLSLRIANSTALCATPSAANVGTNLEKVVDWSAEYVFVNAFKSARNWVPINASYGQMLSAIPLLDLDDDGYLKSLPDCADPLATYCYATTYLFQDLDGHYPAGRYIVDHDGEGKLFFSGDAVVDWSASQVFNGHYELDVTPNNGFTLSIEFTDPNDTGDYIHNIRVIGPSSAAATQTFHPDFLASLGNYKVLRFMDWMRTNWQGGAPAQRMASEDGIHRYDEPQTESIRAREVNGSLPRAQSAATALPWADRPQATNATYATEEGVPLEIMVELANEVAVTPWFNLSHQVDDAYVTAFATELYGSLDADLDFYIELSNEVWNNGFDQGPWMEAEGVAMFGGTTPGDMQRARHNWYGQRSAEICSIFETVFGADAERVNCVVGMQAATGSYQWIAEQILDCPLSANTPCHTDIDAIAIAPYFGKYLGDIVNHTAVATMTLDDLFTELETGGVLAGGPTDGAVAQAAGYMSNYAAEANTRNLNLVTYEGGQHLVGVGPVMHDPVVEQLFNDANNDPRMQDIYAAYFAHWSANGGGLFNHFMSTSPNSKYGNWGTQEYYDSAEHPKLDAITDFMIAPTGCVTCTAALIMMPSLANLVGPRSLPITLTTNGHDVSAATFTLTYDATNILFDSADTDSDNIPDAITFGLSPTDFDLYVNSATAGELAITIAAKQTPLSTITDGATLLTVDLELLPVAGNGITFGSPDYSSTAGNPVVCGNNLGRTVACKNLGSSFTGIPLAVGVVAINATPSAQPWILAAAAMLLLATAWLTLADITRKH